MARGLNQVMLIGNLGAAPDIRASKTGGSVGTLSVATNETWFDKEANERKERTEWHRVVCFGRLAEVAQEYLGKGDKVFVQGRLQTRKWTDGEGVERYTTEIVCNEMMMLGGGEKRTERAPRAPRNESNTAAAQPAADPFNDDIPF